jgi:hypothetical protein
MVFAVIAQLVAADSGRGASKGGKRSLSGEAAAAADLEETDCLSGEAVDLEETDVGLEIARR